MYALTYTVDQIRAAEAPLIEGTERPDELMQKAAHAVAEVARSLYDPREVLILAGPGGNGGDALYAGAELALAGIRVAAHLTAGKAHDRALAAFTNAGGTLPDDLPEPDLIIDGITGIGGSAGLRDNLRAVVGYTQRSQARVLSVDVPSGVAADTGEAGELHVTADATLTFGGWRRVHALAPECGLQLLADISELGARLVEGLPVRADDGPPSVLANRAVLPADLELPEGIVTLPKVSARSVEPSPTDDKYSGGVVGIRAGSGQYPGAALLSVAGAVNATPAMVRYVGPQALEVVRRHPEVVVTEKLEDAGRVQAWVFGPGAGTEDTAELEWILRQDVPVLVDADGLTLLAQSPDLRRLLRDREKETVLTPHDGEFARLQEVVGVPHADRLTETMELARELGATILRKGRSTIIVSREAFVVDAGHSWAATPGSGDVLSGIAGARLALPGSEAAQTMVEAVSVHAVAAKRAAQTPYGDAPAPASRIAEFVREATAR